MADIHVVADELRGFANYLRDEVVQHDLQGQIREQASGRGCHPAGMTGLFTPLVGPLGVLRDRVIDLCNTAAVRVDNVGYALDACADDYEHIDRRNEKNISDAGSTGNQRSAS